jgi:uncharacterized protein YggU (UPF0235/DUF167 family)
MQISVRVVAGAKREGIETLPKNRLKISVKPKAEGGAANKRALELIALHFKIPIKKVHIIRGNKTPSKILAVG